MMLSPAKRTVAVVALSCSLFAGAATTSAYASPADEAKYLAALKSNWSSTSSADKLSVCNGYKVSHSLMVTETVKEVLKDPSARKAMTKTEWKRVITKYLAWACPNDRPRR